MQRTQVQSLAGEIRSCTQHHQKTKQLSLCAWAACSAGSWSWLGGAPIRAVLLRAEQVSRVTPRYLGGTQYSSSSAINLPVRGLIWLLYNQQNIVICLSEYCMWTRLHVQQHPPNSIIGKKTRQEPAFGCWTALRRKDQPLIKKCFLRAFDFTELHHLFLFSPKCSLKTRPAAQW